VQGSKKAAPLPPIVALPKSTEAAPIVPEPAPVEKQLVPVLLSEEEEIVPPQELTEEQTKHSQPASRLASIKSKYQESVLGGMHEIISTTPGDNRKELFQVSEETVAELWGKVLDHLQKFASSVFIEVAGKVQVGWQEPSTLGLEVDSKLAEGVIAENKMNLAAAISHITGRSDIRIDLLLKRKQEISDAPRKYLTPKEKFRQMAERNPVLLELQKKLDLDLE
jgi:hypothetical protein